MEENEATAQQALGTLKTMVGEWQAVKPEGGNAFLTVELVAGQSALLERYWEEGWKPANQMVTLYHMDNHRLLLTHYCIAKNQPRMQLARVSANGKTLEFNFVSATNLANPNQGHMHRAVYHFHDPDHFTTEWTWRENQKDTFVKKLNFERTK